ncbi:MAG: DUF1295 domain-containing protein [Clostridia bacterium]
MNISRPQSFLLVFSVYIISFLAGLLMFSALGHHSPLYAMLAADLTATAVVWFFSILYKNSSIYDPYWSVAPMAIITGWMLLAPSSRTWPVLLLVFAVFFWGIRLTLNWAIGWRGLGHQDWRYIHYKEKAPKAWVFTNLLGIHMMPTLLVFSGLVPAYFIIRFGGLLNIVTIVGFLVCLVSVTVQIFSDRQMADFRKSPGSADQCLMTGLWKYSRHPNYLGEICFWWGIWLMQVGVLPSMWYTLAGPVLISLLFLFVSIPMMERYLEERKPCYAGYKKKVSMLIPWIPMK